MVSKKILLFILFIISIYNIFSFLLCYNLSTDNIKYLETNGNIIINYLNPGMDLSNKGMEIGDTVIAINNTKIKNRFFLNNKIIDKLSPNQQIEYTIRRGNNILTFTSFAMHRYRTIDLFLMALFSFLFIIFSLIFILNMSNSYLNTITALFYIFISFEIIGLHVPFARWQFYIPFILSSAFLHILLMKISYLIRGINKSKVFSTFFILEIILTIIWIVSYILWIINENEASYQWEMLSMRLFHVCSLIIMVIVVINFFRIILNYIMKKFFLRLFTGIILLVFFFLLFPIIYSIPIILKFKELLPYDYYFYLFLIPLIVSDIRNIKKH